MAIFISCVLLAHNGQAQTVDNDKLQVSLPMTPLDEKTGSCITLNKDQLKDKNDAVPSTIFTDKSPSSSRIWDIVYFNSPPPKELA